MCMYGGVLGDVALTVVVSRVDFLPSLSDTYISSFNQSISSLLQLV